MLSCAITNTQKRYAYLWFVNFLLNGIMQFSFIWTECDIVWIIDIRWIEHLIHTFSYARFHTYTESFEIIFLSVISIDSLYIKAIIQCCSDLFMISLCRCFVREANKHTYKANASWFTAVIFVSSLINIFVIYCINCQILLFLLHSGNPHEVHNSPFSGFINGWNTSVSKTTFWNISLVYRSKNTQQYQLSIIQNTYRAIPMWKVRRQCNGEPKNSTFVNSLPNEMYTIPHCDKVYIYCILKGMPVNLTALK